ncbi:MAG: 1-phosphofructokinase family hexose kinase [Thermomicrobiales bacterium]
MRLLTITCNTAVDTTYVLDRLEPGAINRVARALPRPGGKGNNVARVLATLGHAPVATGFAAGHTGRFIEDALRLQDVEPAFVSVAGESRVCLTIVEEATGRITEIREPGMTVGDGDARRLLERVGDLAAGAEAAAICGSLPPGLPTDFLARLAGVLRAAGVFTVLDSSGEALRAGLAGRPHLLKPNRDEIAALLGRDGDGDELIALVQTELIGPRLDGDAAVLLSLGAEGAALIRRDVAWRAAAPRVAAVNTVGCGDALLAGYLDGRARGEGDPDALAHAVAVGAAAALQEAVGAIDADDVPRLRREVRVFEAASAAARVG